MVLSVDVNITFLNTHFLCMVLKCRCKYNIFKYSLSIYIIFINYIRLKKNIINQFTKSFK